MGTTLDHVVVWVEDPLRSVEFFEQVVGFAGVRVAEFRAGEVPFPSVRVSDETIVDLMPRSFAPKVGEGAGYPVNHVCFAMSEGEFTALRERLVQHGHAPTGEMQRSFGARGHAPHAYYFRDPDGNVFEARYYE
jgi:catechol 2,3-dioxygenase-like lactoylglutathione lyase family enzyme